VYFSTVLGSADQMNNPPDWGLNATCNTLLSSDDLVKNWGAIYIQESGPSCNDFRESTFIRQTQDVSYLSEVYNSYFLFSFIFTIHLLKLRKMGIELGPTKRALSSDSFLPRI
jgi:hypothetical protein